MDPEPNFSIGTVPVNEDRTDASPQAKPTDSQLIAEFEKHSLFIHIFLVGTLGFQITWGSMLVFSPWGKALGVTKEALGFLLSLAIVQGLGNKLFLSPAIQRLSQSRSLLLATSSPAVANKLLTWLQQADTINLGGDRQGIIAQAVEIITSNISEFAKNPRSLSPKSKRVLFNYAQLKPLLSNDGGPYAPFRPAILADGRSLYSDEEIRKLV